MAAAIAGSHPARLATDPGTQTLDVAHNAFARIPGRLSVIDLQRCNARQAAGCDEQPPTALVGGGGVWEVVVEPRTHRVVTTDPDNATVVGRGGRAVQRRHQHGL